MKHWLIALVLLSVSPVPAAAFWQSRDSNYNVNVVAGGGGGGNVAIDVVGTEKFQSTSSSFTYTGLTTGTPAGLGLVCVWIRATGGFDTIAGAAATWNGVAMTLVSSVGIGSAPSNQQSAMIFGMHNPASGNKTLSLSATNSATDNFVNCVSLGNVNQTSDAVAFPNPTSIGGGNSQLAVTSATGHMAIGALLNQGGSAVVIPTVVFNDVTNGGIINAAADAVASSSGSTAVGTSNSVTSGSIAGVDVSN